MTLEITQLCGIGGAIVYLAAYFLLQFGLIKGEGITYSAMNIAAACMVLISLTTQFNVGSAIIQVSFILLSLVGLLRMMGNARPIAAKAPDRALAKTMFPDIPMRRALKVIKLGEWASLRDGQLTTQDTENDSLYFIYKGQAGIILDGHEIATTKDNELIGELSCLSHQLASATARIKKNSEVFQIKRKDFDRVLEKNADLMQSFARGAATQIKNRLHTSNRKLANPESS